MRCLLKINLAFRVPRKENLMSLAKEDLAKIFSFRKKIGDFGERFGRYSSKKLLNKLLEGIEKNICFWKNNL